MEQAETNIFRVHEQFRCEEPRGQLHVVVYRAEETDVGFDASVAGKPPQTLTYLRNNAQRMDYPRYRREGLPVTSALIESLVKEMNYRVKGSEKFWNDGPSGEAILQIRAALLSDDDRLLTHLRNRPGNPYARKSRTTTLAAAA